MDCMAISPHEHHGSRILRQSLRHMLESTTSANKAGYADLGIEITMPSVSWSQLAVAQMIFWPYLGFDARRIYPQPIREMERQKEMVEEMIEWSKGDREEMEAVGEAPTKVQEEWERLEREMWRKDGGLRSSRSRASGNCRSVSSTSV